MNDEAEGAELRTSMLKYDANFVGELCFRWYIDLDAEEL